MKQTYLITGVQKLVKTSSESKLKVEGYAISFVNPKDKTVTHSVIRRPKQILTDLINSERIPSRIKDWEDIRVSRAMSRIVGKPFIADISFHKAGDTYQVTEQSAVMQPTHPQYGNYKPGDDIAFEQDGCRLEGFINCRVTDRELDKLDEIEMYTDKLVQAKMSMATAFDDFEADLNDFDEEPEVEPELEGAL